MYAFADEFIEIKITRLKGILAGVRAREGEKVLHDVREALRLVVKHSQRFPVFLERPRRLRKRDFRFAAQNCNRSAQLVGGISHEAPLAFERLAETIKQT